MQNKFLRTKALIGILYCASFLSVIVPTNDAVADGTCSCYEWDPKSKRWELLEDPIHISVFCEQNKDSCHSFCANNTVIGMKIKSDFKECPSSAPCGVPIPVSANAICMTPPPASDRQLSEPTLRHQQQLTPKGRLEIREN